MTLKTFDVAEYLDSPEMIAAYLAETFKDGDAGEIAEAIGDVARAKGMTEIAKRSGLTREGLYRALSAKGHPEFTTILKVMAALDLELTPTPVKAQEPV
jgi:probable addiction module antidote protein